MPYRASKCCYPTLVSVGVEDVSLKKLALPLKVSDDSASARQAHHLPTASSLDTMKRVCLCPNLFGSLFNEHLNTNYDS